MIKLTLCEEGADKDGSRKRVKGLNCLPLCQERGFTLKSNTSNTIVAARAFHSVIF